MPIRTCIVTGEKKDQKELLRFTVQGEQLFFDQGKVCGKWRGGYVVSSVSALDKLSKLGKKVGYLLRAPKVKIDLVEIERVKNLVVKK